MKKLTPWYWYTRARFHAREAERLLDQGDQHHDCSGIYYEAAHRQMMEWRCLMNYGHTAFLMWLVFVICGIYQFLIWGGGLE